MYHCQWTLRIVDVRVETESTDGGLRMVDFRSIVGRCLLRPTLVSASSWGVDPKWKRTVVISSDPGGGSRPRHSVVPILVVETSNSLELSLTPFTVS